MNNLPGIFILSLKRLIAFVIDLIAVHVFLLLIEVPISLIFIRLNILDKNLINHNFLPINSLLIPFLLGLSTSALFSGKSIGCRVTKIQIISPKPLSLSIIGCTLRYYVMLCPASLYLQMIFIPYIETSHSATIPLLESSTLLWFILIMPISVLCGYGQQGIHDRIVGIRVVSDVQKNGGEVILSTLSIFSSLVATTILSVILIISIQNLAIYKKIISYAKPMNAFLDKFYYEGMATINHDKNEIARLTEKIMPSLQKSTYRSDMSFISVGLNPISFPKSYPEKDITIPANISIPTASIHVNGFLLRNTKKIMMEIGSTVFTDLMNDPDFNCDYFNLSYRNNIQLVFLELDIKGYCIYNRHSSEPLECPVAIYFGSYIASPPWPIGINTVK